MNSRQPCYSDFLNELIKIQKETPSQHTGKKGLTDSEMAHLIGCSRQLYQATRTGKVPLGYKVVKGAIKIFPGLREFAIYFLTDSADKRAVIADTSTTTHQKPQNKILTVFKKVRDYFH